MGLGIEGIKNFKFIQKQRPAILYLQLSPFPQSGIMKLFTNVSFFALTTNRMSDIQNYRGETTWVLKPLKSANEGQ